MLVHVGLGCLAGGDSFTTGGEGLQRRSLNLVQLPALLESVCVTGSILQGSCVCSIGSGCF